MKRSLAKHPDAVACSECAGLFLPARTRGRPRLTCSARCYRRRKYRREKEAELCERITSAPPPEEKQTPAAVAYSKELHHWMATGERGPDFTKRQPASITSTWVDHACSSCRR